MAAMGRHPAKHEAKITPAFTAQLKCVQAATAPAEWAESLYGLLSMPRLARYTPSHPVPDLWVLDDSSCLGMIRLSVDNNRKTLFDEGSLFKPPDEKVLVDHGAQQRLAEILYEYLYDPQEPYMQDVLLPVKNYKGETPRYLVMHLFGMILPAHRRYQPIVTVRTAKFPL